MDQPLTSSDHLAGAGGSRDGEDGAVRHTEGAEGAARACLFSCRLLRHACACDTSLRHYGRGTMGERER